MMYVQAAYFLDVELARKTDPRKIVSCNTVKVCNFTFVSSATFGRMRNTNIQIKFVRH